MYTDGDAIFSAPNTFIVNNASGSVTATTSYIFKVFSFDQGVNVYVKYEGKFG